MTALRIGGVCWILSVTAFAQTVYNNTPNWVSSDTQVSTGAALVDLDRDGWLDFLVANGNDMAEQHLAVYYNQGDGTFPALPDWQSDDQAYNGHLDVADVDGDGWVDVAVAVLGNSGTQENAVKLYMNNSGVLSSLPDWKSTQIANAFGCAFGDVNNDGRPDLAVATGWPYGNPHSYHNSVHLNINGQLEATPSWQSADTWDYNNVLWVDADSDGWLDLVGTATNTYNRIYRNLGGALETTSSWRTDDREALFSIMATAGDVDGDGLRELLTTDNKQLYGGVGRFRQYPGLPGGFYTQTATWYFNGQYGSSLALADLDDDGRLDLMTGAWWDATKLFLNQGSGFGSAPDWTSGVTSVIEKIVFADIDKDGLVQTIETFPAGSDRLFYLSRQPIQEIVAVRRDGVELGPDGYAVDCEHGWVTVGTAPTVGLEVEYTYSTRLDMAVSNWDNNKGNYVYYNLGPPCVGDLSGDGDTDLVDLAILLSDYGCTSGCAADLDGDDDTDIADLAILLGDYGCE